MFHWVCVPFNGSPVWCKLRCLNATQLEASGGVTLIETNQADGNKSFQMLIEMRNTQEKIIRDIMVCPTFDEVVSLVSEEDFCAKRIREQIEEIKAIDRKGMTTKEKADLEARLYNLELSVAFILPEDTMGYLTSWALGADVSDIKKLSEEQLLDAAFLAAKGQDNPHEHLTGIFTDRDKNDIDKRAWILHHDFMERKKRER